MGKSLPSVISSVVAIAIIAYLIYFCCLRRKRNNGRTFQSTTMIATHPQPQQQQQPYASQSGQVWPTYHHQQALNPSYPSPGYPAQPSTNYIGPPYPMTDSHQHSGMHMPTSVPNSSPYGMPMPGVSNFTSNTHNFSPSAPANDDLPPPYSSVVHGS